MITRPMLAATVTDTSKLRFPLVVSPKLDGIRCLIHPELGPVTRSFKPIPNEYIRECLSSPEYENLDGELMLCSGDFNSVQSAVMSQHGSPEFKFHVFDDFSNPNDPWTERIEYADWSLGHLVRVDHRKVLNEQAVLDWETTYISEGYEGIMLRDPWGAYKSGRSTMREHGLMKLKRFKDAEGVVTGFVERLHNENPLEHDEFGLAKRSSHKAHLTGSDTLGKLVLATPQWGEVNVGTGFDDALRAEIWANQLAYLGRTVTFKYQEVLKDKPRFPVFLRFREEGT